MIVIEGYKPIDKIKNTKEGGMEVFYKDGTKRDYTGQEIRDNIHMDSDRSRLWRI